MGPIINCSGHCTNERCLCSFPPFWHYLNLSFSRHGVDNRTIALVFVSCEVKNYAIYEWALFIHVRLSTKTGSIVQFLTFTAPLGRTWCVLWGRWKSQSGLKLRQGGLKIATSCRTCTGSMMPCIIQDLNHSTQTWVDV